MFTKFFIFYFLKGCNVQCETSSFFSNIRILGKNNFSVVGNCQKLSLFTIFFINRSFEFWFYWILCDSTGHGVNIWIITVLKLFRFWRHALYPTEIYQIQNSGSLQGSKWPFFRLRVYQKRFHVKLECQKILLISTLLCNEIIIFPH